MASLNEGALGADGVTLEQIETAGDVEWLERLRRELVSKTNKAGPVRRVGIPKSGGGRPMLDISTIRDRVVQTAAEHVFGSDILG